MWGVQTSRMSGKAITMTNPRKLLIAVDGSPQSLEAVSYVALNLPPTDFRVNLMYVMPTAPEGLGDLAKDGFFKKNVWDSPLLLVGGGALILLILLFIALWYYLKRETAQEILAQADADYGSGTYVQASIATWASSRERLWATPSPPLA